ncbi:hypothetical protein ASZ90_000463 [hydrocarbon metagenome]|uniref:LysM domain-containing protein n=1 Tax=hydrocarbon metagenome TaxID=938273 RepID=A0A0W8G913_9ZZZZ
MIIPAGGKARAEAPAAAAAAEAAPEKPKAPEQASAPGASVAVSGREAEPARADKPGPARTAGAEKKAAPGTHVIVQGDMISALANRYGVTEKAILKANPGLKPGNLKLGAVIRLPQGATAGAAEPHGVAEVAASAPEPKTEPRTEPKPEPRTGSKLESKPEAKAEGNAEPSPGPKPEAAPEVVSKAPSGPDAASADKPAVETKPGAASKPAAVSDGGQAAQAVRPREHVLEFDDTVSGLAKRYGVTTAAILSANPGLDPKKLKPGRKIKIP